MDGECVCVWLFIISFVWSDDLHHVQELGVIGCSVDEEVLM